MATGRGANTLKLVREADGLEIDLWPLQGLWTEEQYLREFTEGYVEVLPIPTRKHQAVSRFLFLALLAFVQPRGGTVFYAPLRVRLAPGRFREPDLVLLRDANDPRNQNAFWLGADLVIVWERCGYSANRPCATSTLYDPLAMRLLTAEHAALDTRLQQTL